MSESPPTAPGPAGPLGQHRATPEGDGAMTQTDYQRVQESPEFQDLRRRFRTFVFPMTAFFLAWYFLYVLLADYAHDFMSTKVWGNINVGLLMGLGQFVTTFAITMIYANWANKKQDRIANELRQTIEGRDDA